MKKKKKQVLVAAILLITLLIIGLIISFTNMFKSSYKVSDRTLKVREKSSEGYPVMGWVRVQGTNIDYPVLYAQDSNYSLNDVDISFAWTNSSSTTLNDRVILHGHNIRNVSSKPLLNEKEFNDFDFKNNPYGERDFGAFADGNEQIFWKIDYYDKNLEFASEDPSNPEITNRVLTIYLASEH